MVFPHYIFFIINIIIVFIILIIDKKNIKKYIFLSLLGLIFAFIFETATTNLGFWYYYSEPKIPIISLYTWLLYIPYLSFCYFIGNKLENV